MKVLRVFNNNVILAQDGTEQVILTGRGLGFKARPGMAVDASKVVQRFVPSDGRTSDQLAYQLTDIPPEVIRIVTKAIEQSGLSAQAQEQPSLILPIADHITLAIQRAHEGKTIEYPLTAEVQSLYAAEYAQAAVLYRAINAQLGTMKLPESEIVALALHLVNAGFASGDLSQTYKMTGIIRQILQIVEQTFNVTLDEHSANVGRFITHLRYVFVRIARADQLEREPEPIINAIIESYPEAYRCAEQLAIVIETRMSAHVTSDEVAYLALHVARVVSERTKLASDL